MASRGERDRRYVLKLIRTQRSLALLARIVIYAGLFCLPGWHHPLAGWPTTLAVMGLGVLMLGLAKILENMEIAHNVLHAQWDWMRDPDIQSNTWEWDSMSPADRWMYSHNVVHHTWTNMLEKDLDVGYGILRIAPLQKWHPRFLAQPLYAALLMPPLSGHVQQSLPGDRAAGARAGHPLPTALQHRLAGAAVRDHGVEDPPPLAAGAAAPRRAAGYAPAIGSALRSGGGDHLEAEVAYPSDRGEIAGVGGAEGGPDLPRGQRDEDIVDERGTAHLSSSHPQRSEDEPGLVENRRRRNGQSGRNGVRAHHLIEQPARRARDSAHPQFDLHDRAQIAHEPRSDD